MFGVALLEGFVVVGEIVDGLGDGGGPEDLVGSYDELAGPFEEPVFPLGLH